MQRGLIPITTVPGQQVHQNCRRENCSPSSIKLACVADASYLTTVPPVICDIKQAKKSISEEIKQLVVVAPLLAKQSNVSSLRLIVWFFFWCHQSWIWVEFKEIKTGWSIQCYNNWSQGHDIFFKKLVWRGTTSGRKRWALGLWMSTTCLQLTLFTDELPAIKRGKLVAPKWRKKTDFCKSWEVSWR